MHLDYNKADSWQPQRQPQRVCRPDAGAVPQEQEQPWLRQAACSGKQRRRSVVAPAPQTAPDDGDAVLCHVRG